MDFACLEKMGIELKCPICLSLLKSAVTIACNHFFCNSCILESMKSALNCPVCKVPFRRREVRSTPHMDNLVSIYRSMEAASGLNIFTTQVPPSKISDEQVQVHDNKYNAPKCITMQQGRSRGKMSSKGKRKKMEKDDTGPSDHCPSHRPSFQANKRIHVTPYPISETPVQHKRANKAGASTAAAMDTSKVVNNKNLDDETENSALPPFFWLGEANEEDEGSQRPSAQETPCLTSPINVPCFSDIKDSEDDRTPKKVISNNKSTTQEAFDSEMFELTQRACSPELFPTPLNRQTAGSKRFSGFLKDRESSHRIDNQFTDLESSKVCHLDKNAKITKTACTMKRISKKRRKHNKETNVEVSIYETLTISLDDDHPFGSIAMVEDLSQENKPFKQKDTPSSTSKGNKRTRKPRIRHQEECLTSPLRDFNYVGIAYGHRELRTKSKEDTQNKGIEGTSKTSSKAADNKFMDVVLDVQNKSLKRTKKDTTTKTSSKATFKSLCQSKRLSLNHAELKTHDANISGNPSEDKSQNCELGTAKSRLQLLSFKLHEGGDTSRRKCRTDHNTRTDIGAKVSRQKSDVLAARADRKQNTSTDHVVQEDNQPCMNLQKPNVSSRTKGLHLITNNVLQKCKKIDSFVTCAFCHSSSDSEISGEMMHYYNGQLVAADYNGGINIIHSHKNCTEWAPDVYFKDDLVINLSAELGRSKRITCSCCGIKGAALGCFEKSCRRSFHYPCAKQTPECRLDNENFVMLCPFHSSSKFPSETIELQKQSRTSKEEVQQLLQPKAVDDKSCMWTWPSGFPYKWVLCSSALSGPEKELLSKFARLTGISISKTWSPLVTHVIASTDENGACRRTLKFLMGIINGKWILNMEWIKACMKSMKPVDEEQYEITADVHGICNGPHLGRMRIINKEPKLFRGFCFYFIGEFVPSYKGYLQELTTAAGGKVLQRKPISRKLESLLGDSSDITFIVYGFEFPKNKRKQDGAVLGNRKTEAMALAEACGAKVVTNSWILDSIAASALQVLPC